MLFSCKKVLFSHDFMLLLLFFLKNRHIRPGTLSQVRMRVGGIPFCWKGHTLIPGQDKGYPMQVPGQGDGVAPSQVRKPLSAGWGYSWSGSQVRMGSTPSQVRMGVPGQRISPVGRMGVPPPHQQDVGTPPSRSGPRSGREGPEA